MFRHIISLIKLSVTALLILTSTSCIGPFSTNTGNTPEINNEDSKQGIQTVIDIQTSKLTKIRPEAVGEHNAITNQTYVMNSKDFLKAAEDYGRLGFIRWTGGTSNNAVNWRLGAIDAEYTAQTFPQTDRYYKQVGDRINVEAKGFERISALKEFLQKTGSKVNIVANVFQQSPDEIGDLAKYLYENHIPLIYFELGNEVQFFTETSDSYLIYKSGTDYLDRGKAFNDAIKKYYPGAKVVVAMSNKGKDTRFDNDIYNYQNRYWDAITVHRFQGNGKDLTEAMKSGNSALEEWKPMLDEYVKKFKDPNLEIYIGEQSPALGGTLAGTMYQGVYQAESVMRLLSHPNLAYTVGWYIDRDSLDFSYIQNFNDAWQTGESVDSINMDYNLFARIPTLGARIAAGAINQSEAYWETIVTGGAQVDASVGKKPAIYSKAFKGANGINYIVITNKSAEAHNVTISMDGKNVTAKDMTKTYIGNDKPGIKNAGKTPNNVKIVTQNTQNPVYIPPYSVTRVEWKDNRAADKPNPPALIYSDAGNGTVDLKWSPALRAAGYKVKYGTEPGKYNKTLDAGNVTQYTVSGLQTDKTYYFAVSAYNKTGESLLSNEASVVLAAPDRPLIRKAYAERASRAAIEWQSVPNTTGYKLMYGTQPGKYDKTIDMGNNLGQIVTGLTNETKYYFAVQAYNGAGNGQPSEEVSVIPKDSLPLAPYYLMIRRQSETSAALEWRPSLADTVLELFNDNNISGWSPISGVWKTAQHPAKGRNTGVYKLAEGEKGITLYKGGLTKDYEVEAVIDASRTSAREQIGIIAQFKDENNFYAFKFENSTSTFYLTKVVEGKETVIQEKTLTVDPALLRMHLRLVGNKILAIANENEIAEISDSAHSSGKAGLFTTGTNGLFDYVRIYEANTDFCNIYRSTDPYTGYVKIAGGIEGTEYEDNTVAEGKTYYYYVKAENGKGESYHHSNTARKN